MAILSFGDKRTETVFRGVVVPELPPEICRKARIRLDAIDAAPEVAALRFPPGNRLEKLKGSLREWYSIRVNDQWRIMFKWEGNGAAAVQVVDYHDWKK